MRLHSAIAIGLATVALVAAGCGGTSKEDYEKEIDGIGQTLDEQFTDIGRDIQSSGSLENAADDVEKGADALDDAAADLEDIDPPDDAEEAHAKIVAGVRSLADDFREAARAAGANDAQKVLDLFGNIEASEGFKKIQEARAELKDAGYNVEQ
jgi:hypothetical protein